MNTKICSAFVFAFFCNQVFAIDTKNLSTLAKKHSEKCDCLMKTGQPFQLSLEIFRADCWAKCFKTSACFAFEYYDQSKLCKLYNDMSIGYNALSVEKNSCERHPNYGYFEFYIIKRVENGETFDCESIKLKNSLADDDYFDIKIRGVVVRVFCVMTATPAKTYVDVAGKSVWGGSLFPHNAPAYAVNRTWSRVQIQTSSCLTSIICDDMTFR